jgi:hypothetical protein
VTALKRFPFRCGDVGWVVDGIWGVVRELQEIGGWSFEKELPDSEQAWLAEGKACLGPVAMGLAKSWKSGVFRLRLSSSKGISWKHTLCLFGILWFEQQ